MTNVSPAERVGLWVLTNLGQPDCPHPDTVDAIIAHLGSSSIPDALEEIRLALAGPRLERLRELVEEYPGAWAQDREGALFEELAGSRYAAIIERHPRGTDRQWSITTSQTLPDALALLADALLDWSMPHGVVDLDTGEAHGIHVATPLVSDVGAEGAPVVPWSVDELEAFEPGEGATSQGRGRRMT